MAEAITPHAGEARTVEPRRLHPVLAFLGGLVGLGYVYVGRIGYAIAFAFASYLLMFAGAWARVFVDPAGWYGFFAGMALLWLTQLVHPIVLAWSRPLAPARLYNRWWGYIGWLTATTALSFVLVPDQTTTLGHGYYSIPASSMYPTVQPGDRIVVDTWCYRDAPPAFGDIVVGDFGDGILIVKRVVGVPGDKIELRGQLLVRNGSLVDEPYLNAEQTSRLPDSAPLTLATDEFFVLGDNRGNSFDSRQRGPLTRDRISGRVEFVAFSRSWDRFALVLARD
jgi:signal peptidase I